MVTLHSEAERILESWEQGKLPVITATQQHKDTSQGNKTRER